MVCTVTRPRTAILCAARAPRYHGAMDRVENFAGVEDIDAQSTGWFTGDQADLTEAALAEATQASTMPSYAVGDLSDLGKDTAMAAPATIGRGLDH